MAHPKTKQFMKEISSEDLCWLQQKGISEEKFEQQLKNLSEGFPYLKLESAATVGNGISALTPQMEIGAIKSWDSFLEDGGKVIKMVPASGAASRMFKELFSFLNGDDDKPTAKLIDFFSKIEDFAFFPQLNKETISQYGLSVTSLCEAKRYKDIVRTLILKDGMNYGSLPKALLEFHKVMGGSRTPFEEHLAEAAQYACGKDGIARVHFTASEDHIPLMQTKLEESAGHLGHEYGAKYDVTFSIQKPSTDTVAVNMDGTPYKENGKFFFRPGGHGALIENLNDLDADVIFIKNIDNVVPDTHRGATLQYKRVLGGTLVAVKQSIDTYCKLLSEKNADDAKLEEMLTFMHNVLCITNDNAANMNRDEKIAYIYSKLNRPVRVCGMVRNEGEPGGGPFLVYNKDNTVSPQILESSQIDKNDPKAVAMLNESTHFNPVDLAVATRDWQGNKFDLTQYVDQSTGFISYKSREGVEIKCLELPGLWNGAMSDWNTLFIEVASQTFNPVKTVNDLLRQAHQPFPENVEA